MRLKRSNIFSLVVVIMMAAICSHSCTPSDLDFTITPGKERQDESATRLPISKYQNVFLVYSMGYNDIYSYLKDDIKDLVSSPLMQNRRDIMLIFSHLANKYPGERYPSFNEPTCPTLTKVYRNIEGDIVKDTLLVLPETEIAADPQTMKKILTYTKENFEAESYGVLFSSHGSGWAPKGYINDPSDYEYLPDDDDELIPIRRQKKQDTPVYNMGREDGIDVKSMGVHNLSLYETKELNINEIAAAFPFKMDYVIFDACYMGGIEVAYELRNVTDRIIFSQTEILGDGMDYKTMASYIYSSQGPDLVGFCQRYFDYYNSQSGLYKSATISLIDCTKLEELAQTTKGLLGRYRSGLEALQTSRNAQRYFRSSYASKHQWFYDFGDIMAKCGLSEEDLASFNERLNAAVLYKASTPYFMSDIKMEHHSGLSMYLPLYQNRIYLNNFYKTLEWNKAVELVL